MYWVKLMSVCYRHASINFIISTNYENESILDSVAIESDSLAHIC